MEMVADTWNELFMKRSVSFYIFAAMLHNSGDPDNLQHFALW
jgi:hypothetical protein